MSQSPKPQADLEFARVAAQLAVHTRCTDVVLLDVSERSQVTHYFLIATGTSSRQMTTVAEQIAELGEKMGFKPWRTSGAENAKWILIDCVDVVVHLFDAPSRTFYDLEMLWGDCPRVELNLPEGIAPQTAQTDAALEAIQEVIEAVTDSDDELLMMEMTDTGSEQENPDPLPLETDTDQGIAAPPDDHAIRYQSISIEVSSDDAAPPPGPKSRATPPATSRRRATKPKASSTVKRVAAKGNTRAKRSQKTASGTRAAAKTKPVKATAKKKTATTHRGKLQAKGSKISKPVATARGAGKRPARAKAAKSAASKPKASAKKASSAKAAGKAKSAKISSKVRLLSGTGKKRTSPKTRK